MVAVVASSENCGELAGPPVVGAEHSTADEPMPAPAVALATLVAPADPVQRLNSRHCAPFAVDATTPEGGSWQGTCWESQLMFQRGPNPSQASSPLPSVLCETCPQILSHVDDRAAASVGAKPLDASSDLCSKTIISDKHDE